MKLRFLLVILILLVKSSFLDAMIQSSSNSKNQRDIKIKSMSGELLLKLPYVDFKKSLKKHSDVILNQCEDSSNSKKVFKKVFVPNGITKEHLDMLLYCQKLGTWSSHGEDKGKILKKDDWFRLLEIVDALNITDERILILLEDHVRQLVKYCRKNKILYEGILSGEIKQEMHKYAISFLLPKASIPFTCKRIVNGPAIPVHTSMCQDGEKILILSNGEASVYSASGQGIEFKIPKKEIVCAGLSADGTTIMVGKRKKDKHKIFWYVFTGEKVIEKGALILPIQNENRLVKNSLASEPYSARDHDGDNRSFMGDSHRSLANIFIADDGKKAFLKFTYMCPLVITLNDSKDNCEEYKFINKSTHKEEWYQQIIAMSSQGKCAHMLYDCGLKHGKECRYVAFDSNDSHEIDLLDSREYFYSQQFNNQRQSLVDSLTLDHNARHMLKIENRNATLAYINSADEVTITDIFNVGNDRVYAGALSLDGNLVILGGATGQLYIYDTKLRNIVQRIDSPTLNNLGSTKTLFDSDIHKFVPVNPQGVVELATNRDGTKFVVARSSGDVDYYTIDIKQYVREMDRNIDFDNLDALSDLYKLHYRWRSRAITYAPVNIENRFPLWIENILKNNMAVRFGFGPKSSLDVIRNENVGFYYKCAEVAPYITALAPAAVAGYFTIKQLLNK